MNFRDYQFRPRILPTLAALVTLPVLFSLGIWQLDRASEKERLATDLEHLGGLAPLVLDATNATDTIPAYRQIAVRGQFETDRQIFLENRRQGNRIGFQVITPLRIENSDQRLMVNRGWVPANGQELPIATAPTETVVVKGVAHIPEPPAIALGNPDDWGRSWPYFTIKDYAAREQVPLLPVLLLQAPDNSHGFERYWPTQQPNPMMHLGYAIQWFAFALIAGLICLRLSFEHKEPHTA